MIQHSLKVLKNGQQNKENGEVDRFKKYHKKAGKR